MDGVVSGASGRGETCQVESCSEAGEIARGLHEPLIGRKPAQNDPHPLRSQPRRFSYSKEVLQPFQTCLLFAPELPGTEEEQGSAKALCQQHTPSAGNDFTGVRRISRPG